MQFALHEHLVNLGSLGLLALTTEFCGTCALPLPARNIGYAYWCDGDGRQHDRFDLCSRSLSHEAVTRTITKIRDTYPNLPAVAGDKLNWQVDQATVNYVQLPQHAGDLGQGRALLVFAGSVGPALLRVVDMVTNTVLTEETADDLMQRLGIHIPDYLLDTGLFLYASGNGLAKIAIHADFRLFRFTGTILELALPDIDNLARDDVAFSATHLYLRNRETGQIRSFPLAGSGDLLTGKPRHARKGYAGIAAAANVDRFATADHSGLIEVIDNGCASVAALRVAPPVHRSQFALSISPNGRYLLAMAWEHTWLIDIDRRAHSLVDHLMPREEAPLHQEETGVEVRFLPASCALDDGFITLNQGRVQSFPTTSLEWQAALPAKAARRTQPPVYKALLETWRRPAIALRPGKYKPDRRSHFYGHADLPPDTPLPEYDGKPMTLLCQIDLTEVAATAAAIGLPDHGLLGFYAAENDEGEALTDDFEPIATQVLWTPEVATAVVRHVATNRKPLGIRLVKDRTDLPAADASVVQTHLLHDNEIAEYQYFLDSRFREGLPSGHRLGGYPTLLQSFDPAKQAAALANDGREARGWRLLLQLDSDDEFMWGTDTGMLYFMIHEDDLARTDFSRVQAFCEGY